MANQAITESIGKMDRVIPPDTALRDIHDLMEKGILRDTGEGGRNKNYELVSSDGAAKIKVGRKPYYHLD